MLSAGSPEPLKPTVLGVWLGSVLMVIGVICAVVIAVIAVRDVSDRVDSFPRITVPSDKLSKINFSKPGRYVVYLEYSAGDGEPRTPLGLNVYVCPAGAGAKPVCDKSNAGIEVVPYSNDISFSIRGSAGKALFRFQVTEAGDYWVNPVDAVQGNYTVMVGSSVINAIIGPVLAALAIGGGLFALGLVLLIVTLVRRSRARKVRRGAGGGPVWGPGQPPMPFGTPPPPRPGMWNPPPPAR